MSWEIVNVVLSDERAILGSEAASQDLVRRILADGFEPFETAALPGVGLIISFRKPAEAPDFRPVPGHYL